MCRRCRNFVRQLRQAGQSGLRDAQIDGHNQLHDGLQLRRDREQIIPTFGLLLIPFVRTLGERRLQGTEFSNEIPAEREILCGDGADVGHQHLQNAVLECRVAHCVVGLPHYLEGLDVVNPLLHSRAVAGQERNQQPARQLRKLRQAENGAMAL